MKLIATKTFTYAGRRIAVGDVFETKTERDAKLLIGIKNARNIEERVEEKVPTPKPGLVEQASKPKKVEHSEPEVKPVVELVTPSEEDKPEPKPEVVPEIEPEKTPEPEIEEKPESKPVVAEDTKPAAPKRNYNRKN